MNKKYYKATEAYYIRRGIIKTRRFLGCILDVERGTNTDIFTDGELTGGGGYVIKSFVKDGWLEEIPKQEAALLFGRV